MTEIKEKAESIILALEELHALASTELGSAAYTVQDYVVESERPLLGLLQFIKRIQSK